VFFVDVWGDEDAVHMPHSILGTLFENIGSTNHPSSIISEFFESLGEFGFVQVVFVCDGNHFQSRELSLGGDLSFNIDKFVQGILHAGELLCFSSA